MSNDYPGIRCHWSKYKVIGAGLILTALLLAGNISFAAEKSQKYQIVAVNDKAYLLDKTTGFTWILTYRTIATGREPVAIPYKFIKISPANQKDFIVETEHGVSLLPNGVQ
jgi:hypothetical protein